MRIMHDGIASDALLIPATTQLVAGYVDGLYAWSAADWDRFPHSVKVRIAVFTSTDDGHVLDVEPGNDMTPSHWVSWVQMRRKAGVDPTIYVGENNWQLVRDAFQSAKVAEPHYWVARYDNIQQIPAGAVAKQYADAGSYDLSVVADYWPGVDPTPQGVQVEQADKVTGNLSRGNTVGDVLADLSNFRDWLYLGYGVADGNNPPSNSSRISTMLLKILDIDEKVSALSAPTVDTAALAAALAASPQFVQAVAHAIAVELHNITPAS